VIPYTDFEQSIELHNGVPQGLASRSFPTISVKSSIFLSPAGSDCEIVNLNIGPSNAEIGGAFGGEKKTGGSRWLGCLEKLYAQRHQHRQFRH
jgi:aldehyde dehydrogenase (NAD+)